MLKDLFGTIHIPNMVKNEIERYFSSDENWRGAIRDGMVDYREVQHVGLNTLLKGSLDAGEAEAICIAVNNKAELFLCDDQDARQKAQELDLCVAGTVGCLVKAKELGLIEEVGKYMDVLRTDHCFWINEQVYNKARVLAGEI